MPTKCIDQMPPPIATAAAEIQAARARATAVPTLSPSSSAV